MSRNDIVERLRDRAYSTYRKDPLVEEAADEIERLEELRKLDGESIGRSLEEYNRMKELCVNGKYLTAEEREAVEIAIRWLEPYPQVAATLRKLLERLK